MTYLEPIHTSFFIRELVLRPCYPPITAPFILFLREFLLAATPNPSRGERLLSYFEYQSKASTPDPGEKFSFNELPILSASYLLSTAGSENSLQRVLPI
uniref:Uncharacterized protein n=1 Tax=Picea glauca TaxID=3330 RepID=A0A101LYF8_PICGL|nr:hypothetical protein ABT39_MTgene5783 [Picea glauca]QHR90441.1 hypothetical protein Q903MT_gene4465 [Picea sitchensis]